MISVIICSIDPVLRDQVEKNIRETVGFTDVEILSHDNRTTKWGICKVYNHYACVARHNILCFVHEDVCFHTPDWGKEIADFIRRTPRVGVIGFAGAQIKTNIPSGWGCGAAKYTRMNLIQGLDNGETKHYHQFPKGEAYSHVVSIDGLCMICPKHVWEASAFDEENFREFHLYDLSFSLQATQNFDNYVCNTISVEHFSEGNFNAAWEKETYRFHEIWNKRLPMAIPGISKADILRCNDKGLYIYYKMLVLNKMTDLSPFELIKEFISTSSGIKYTLKYIFFLCIEVYANPKYRAKINK